jgi:hypothetical protein
LTRQLAGSTNRSPDRDFQTLFIQIAPRPKSELFGRELFHL